LDVETERFFGTSIERLRNRHLTSNDFRLVASQALKDVLSQVRAGRLAYPRLSSCERATSKPSRSAACLSRVLY
jgi:hypothetical protein